MGLAALLLGPALPAEAGTDSVTTPLSPASRRARTSFSFRPWLSADGRYVAFDSDAATFVAGDTNRERDVFVHDRATGTTTRVSVGPGEAEADGQSQRPTLSADGRYVAFWSDATNLVPGDTNGVSDAFVHDRVEGVTHRVSVGPDGTQADGASVRPVVSGDGRVVAFESAARNLLPPTLLNRSTDSNRVRDVFVHDLGSGVTTRVSVASDGAQGTGDSVRPSISADGNIVAFHTDAVFEPGDTNTARDVYAHDRTTGVTSRVSRSTSGAEGNAGSFSPSLSADGRLVTFWSNASNFAADDGNAAGDIFVHDRTSGATERVSVTSDAVEADAHSSDPAISADGRYVTFWSLATNLVPDDGNGVRDIFLHDRETATTVRVSVASDGTEGDADSFSPNVSGGGLVAFDSEATTLVPGDTNRGSDIFIHTPDIPSP